MKGRRIRRGREPPSPALEDGSRHREWYVVCFVNSEHDTKQSSGDLMAHTPFAPASSGFRTSRRVNNVRNIERWASVATASAVIAYGVSRRNKQGMWLAAAAAPLAYRGVVGEWPRLRNGRARDDTRASLSGAGGIHVHESIRLEKPLGEVYRFWRRFENLPQFMSHLEQVSDLGKGRSRWVACGPAGTTVQWDAEISNEIPNETIAWRSLPGSDVVTAGSVTFKPARASRSTQLTVHLQYDPPAGRAGAWVAALFGREPTQTIREDLRRVKQLMETGEIARAYSNPRRLRGSRR